MPELFCFCFGVRVLRILGHIQFNDFSHSHSVLPSKPDNNRIKQTRDFQNAALMQLAASIDAVDRIHVFVTRLDKAVV